MNPASNSRCLAPATDRVFGPGRLYGAARYLGPASDRVFGPARYLGPINN